MDEQAYGRPLFSHALGGPAAVFGYSWALVLSAAEMEVLGFDVAIER